MFFRATALGVGELVTVLGAVGGACDVGLTASRAFLSIFVGGNFFFSDEAAAVVVVGLPLLDVVFASA